MALYIDRFLVSTFAVSSVMGTAMAMLIHTCCSFATADAYPSFHFSRRSRTVATETPKAGAPTAHEGYNQEGFERPLGLISDKMDSDLDT